MLRRGRLTPASVWLEPQVELEIFEEAGYHHPLETGGVLLGYADADDPDLILVSAQVGPGPHARHRRNRFEPHADWQQARIEERYRDSGRVVSYLGDWHSHPAGSGQPSRIDRRTARRIARERQARSPKPLILIAHGAPGEWQLTAHRWARRRLRLARLVEQ